MCKEFVQTRGEVDDLFSTVEAVVRSDLFKVLYTSLVFRFRSYFDI